VKILHVITSLDPRGGGVAEALRQFAPALLRQGHQNEIAALDAPGSPWLESFPATVHALGPAKTSYQYSNRLTPWLRAHRDEFDCVISHGLWQHGGFAAWKAWQGAATPRFVFAHGMLDPWFKRNYPRKHLKKWLYWPWAEYRILREARGVFFTCEEERRLARESFWLYRCREEIVNLGIGGPTGDPARQQALFFEKFPQLQGKRLLLFLGRLHEKKGCDLLLDAFGKIDPRAHGLHLVMAGPGEADYTAELRRRADSLDGGASSLVTWAGMLTGDVKWGAFRAAEAFILPSHQENFGLAVAEALACGCPALLSDKVNIWREVEADSAGFSAPDDAPGTLDLLRRWLSLSAEARAAIRERARQCFENRFQIDRAAAALAEKLRALGVREQR
jgi:glycosyltransferase involved in cell wall biosynthesis